MNHYVKPLLKLLTDKYLFIFLVFIDLIWVCLYLYPGNVINVYLLRDIERSFSITNGAFPWVGSDTISGGFTGGSTFYFLIWPAVWLSNANVKFVIIYSLLLRTAVYSLSSIFLNKYFRIQKCICFLILSSMLFPNNSFSWLTNATYIFLLVPIILILFYRFLILKPDKYEGIKIFLLSLLVGCATHIHITMWYLMVILLIFVFNRHQNNLISLLKKIAIMTVAAVSTQGSYLFLSWVGRENPLKAKAILHYNIYDVRFFLVQYQSLFENLPHVDFTFRFGEFIVVLLISILATVNEFFLKPRRLSNLYLRTTSLFLSIALLINLPYMFQSYTLRYLSVLYITSVLIFLISFGNYTKKFNSFRTAAYFLSVLIFIYAHTRKFKNIDLNIDLNIEQIVDYRSSKIICNYFNSNNISFDSFLKNTFEVMPTPMENSFWNAKFCFNTIVSKSPTTENKRYFIVHKALFEKSTNTITTQVVLPDEISATLPNSPLMIEATLPSYLLVSYIPNSLNLEKYIRLSNLTFSYELDPGLSINHQLNSIKNIFIANSEESVQIYEAKLCRSPVYCSVFVFTQRQENKLKILITSRILQTIWSLPPVAAALKNFKINMFCDEAPQNILIASRIGSFEYLTSDFDVKYKNFRTPVELLEPIQCRNLKIESLSIDSGVYYNPSRQINIQKSQFPLVDITEELKTNNL